MQSTKSGGEKIKEKQYCREWVNWKRIGYLNRRKRIEKKKNREYNISSQYSFKLGKKKVMTKVKSCVLIGKGHDFLNLVLK